MIQSLLITKQVDQIGENLQKKFLEFLENYQTTKKVALSFLNEEQESDIKEDDEEPTYFYLVQAEMLRNTNGDTMYVDIKHLYDYDITYELRELILNEFYRFEEYLNKAVEELMKKLYFSWAKDIKFYNSFFGCENHEKIRDLRTQKIGKLISLLGTVTKTSEVKPELVVGSFICNMCKSHVNGVEQQFRYTEPKICQNANCNNRSKWELNVENSTFADWQKLRVQENSNDIPAGSIPRSIDVILRNAMVESCKPGDKCILIGTLIAVPDVMSLVKPGEKINHQLKREAVRKEEQRPMDGVSGLKNLGIRDMTYKLIFSAQFVDFVDSRDNPIGRTNKDKRKLNINSNQYEKIIWMKDDPNIYSKLSKCIAPSVYGQDEVKKGILLMLFGGVHKSTREGIKLRGDLNVCVVGDPSTAKSQFLKYVCQLIPKAVYTSGKGSSAAGLTAGIMRDSETGEFCIEAGALMLADNGICCIDEFDKMDSKDQVAIHEAMEQQTISIAKAGINATLMSRTSILAAANPAYGRYDKTKSLKYNINMTAPILSRFDLFFIIVDDCNTAHDSSIAQHIVNLHRLYGLEQEEEHNKNMNYNINEEQRLLDLNVKESFNTPYTQEQLSIFLNIAKDLNPKFTSAASEKLREEYKKLRQGDISAVKSAYRITVRQLESLIRLSEALARVHLDTLIHPVYVQEAARLLKKSIIHIEEPDVELNADFERDLMEQRRKLNQDGDNVVMMDAEAIHKKIYLSGAEYSRLSKQIVYVMQCLESEDIKPKHKDIVSYIIEENFNKLESTAAADELANKISAIIDNLVNKEGILLVSSETDTIEERVLSLNVNYDPQILS